MYRKIFIEADLGKKGVERCDIAIYVDDKLLTTLSDKSYADLQSIAHELKSQYQNTEGEIWCSGDDCCGKTHRWKIDT